MNIIIYGSQYGTAKQYSKELAGQLNYELRSYDEVKDLDAYDNIIYIGSLYAGGILGMKKTFRKIRDIKNKNFIIATVGLGDPSEKSSTEAIKRGLKRQLPENIFKRAHIFHLRGGVDYSRMSFVHKTMMGMLYKKVVSMPEEKRSADAKAMIETYNKKVSYVDLSKLAPIVSTAGSFSA
ncbi:MAG: hypothetical protein J6M17_13710 [Ruminococcus sp.]|nr:hypothetical protein [Ruminococcus sp.]